MSRSLLANKAWAITGAVAGLGLAFACVLYVLDRSRPPSPASDSPSPDTPIRHSSSPASPPSDLPRHRSPILLRDVTGQAGITFTHTDGGNGKYYIVEAMSAGLALFDYDGDGYEDVYFLNGAPLLGTKVDAPPRNGLYRNEGNWKFTDVTDLAGVGDTGFGLGVTVGDYDNDGDLDLYLNNYGPNVLYRNNGDGTFTDVTKEAGVACGNKVGAGTCFLDIEGDGDLDLYVSNYVQFSYDTHKADTIMGAAFYPGPLDHPPELDTLYENKGDGSFTDVSVQSGVAQLAATGMGVISCDYDNDGDTDVFVANDEMANSLLENDGNGNFQEVAIPGGVAYDVAGMPQGSMGVECGDYDNDGWLDFHVTSYEGELALLYRNIRGRFFSDVTHRTGAAQGTLDHVTWGNGLVDFDNDGDLDVFIACGHTDENSELRGDNAFFLARNILLMNSGGGKFVNVSESSGNGMAVKLCSRGTGFDDLDNDGDVDVVILNRRREPTILRNDTVNENHWIQIRLRGAKTNRDGVGAHVKVAAGDLTQIDEVHSGRGYQSHYGMRLHFGLGKRDHVDRIEVRWIGGGVDVLENVAVDQLLVITEGTTRAPDPHPPAD